MGIATARVASKRRSAIYHGYATSCPRRCRPATACWSVGAAKACRWCPGFAILDPTVTLTAQDGLYVVYLFDAHGATVYLTMNQGATQHLETAKRTGLIGVAAERAAIEQISLEFDALRSALELVIPERAHSPVQLHADRFLPRAYEVGSIAAIRYELSDLPGTQELVDDLTAFLTVYSAAVQAKDQLAANQQIQTSARGEPQRRQSVPKPVLFRPKDSSDYTAHVPERHERRTRRHEALIERFGRAAMDAGYEPNTNVHPRDLTVTASSGTTWLVEAKTVGANTEPAVRDAIGQLVTYRHFYYREAGLPDPQLLALFEAPVGNAFEQLLASLGIHFVAQDHDGWTGSSAALTLVDRLIGSL